MFLSTNRFFFNLSMYFLSLSNISNSTSALPSFIKIFDNKSNSSKFDILIFKLLIGLFIISSKGIIFLTFILIFCSLSLKVLVIVIITDLPSFMLFLFNSKTSEKTNNSNIPPKSENFIIAYDVPFCVFFSCIFNIVEATILSD